MFSISYRDLIKNVQTPITITFGVIMGRAPNLTGQVFGRWTVIKQAETDKNFNARWHCVCECGTEKDVIANSLRSGKSLSCGCLKVEHLNARGKGSDHFNYKGGVSKSDANGYLHVLVSEHEGFIPEGWKHKYITEHRVVMAQHLGRPLKKHENVHHINGDKTDNRIENLELWLTHQPKGQRVEDAIEYAVAILQEFAPELLK